MNPKFEIFDKYPSLHFWSLNRDAKVMEYDLFDHAYKLMIDSLEAQAVLRHLEIKCPRSDDMYGWMRAACWSRFDFDSQALADQYRNVLDPIDEYINPPTANEMKAN